MRDQFEKDLYLLHQCDSEARFDAVVPLFLEYWKSKTSSNTAAQKAVEHYESYWLSGALRNHYQGVYLGAPTTNNVNESMNKLFKQDKVSLYTLIFVV